VHLCHATQVVGFGSGLLSEAAYLPPGSLWMLLVVAWMLVSRLPLGNVRCRFAATVKTRDDLLLQAGGAIFDTLCARTCLFEGQQQGVIALSASPLMHVMAFMLSRNMQM
jgi:hypothetical protein